MSDLFPIEETLSPRLKWMRENRIETYDNSEAWGEEPGTWIATLAVGNALGLTACHWATAPTEDEAIVELAKKLNIKLWNEL